MTRVRPFPALRYDPARVDLGRVVVPPYDVIAAADREAFYDRDPHNAIRLELTRNVADEAGTDYADVRATLESWQAEGVLVHDAAPSFYALRQTFRAPEGGEHTREGFFALLHLEDYEARIVRPHERTLAGPKADRLKMLRATKANLSVVFLLYEDRDQELAGVLSGAFEAGDLGVAEDQTGAVHRLARVGDEAAAETIHDFLARQAVVIADGHHRYETALKYRDECRAAGQGDADDAPHEWILAYFANAYAPGSLLLPIHRLVLEGDMPSDEVWSEQLTEWRVDRVSVASAEAVPEALTRHLEPLADQHAFALDDASGTLRIFSRKRDEGDALTVRIIHGDIIEGVFGLSEDAVREGAIAYPKSALQTARDLRAGEGAVAIYLNPLAPEDVFRVTGAGEVLPQKSTFFYPKLPSGLVFRTLDEG
jgi:uncharacterized protein (DUF1015 family)